MMKPQKFGSDSALLAAYLGAHYKVTGTATPFVLRVGHPSAELASLHRSSGVNCSAFITAWNPRSVATSENLNRASQQRLESQLTAMSLTFLAGIGEDPAGVWPGEPSALVLGISRSEAECVGRTFGQLAIVWSGEPAIPDLVVLR
jgi:Protein of unknown function (DUF3293)